MKLFLYILLSIISSLHFVHNSEIDFNFDSEFVENYIDYNLGIEIPQNIFLILNFLSEPSLLPRMSVLFFRDSFINTLQNMTIREEYKQKLTALLEEFLDNFNPFFDKFLCMNWCCKGFFVVPTQNIYPIAESTPRTTVFFA